MATKLTETQHGLLSLIKNATRHKGNDSANEVIAFWVPGNRHKFEPCPGFPNGVYASGSGAAKCLRAMEVKGWIRRHGDASSYNYSITEDGTIALESHREATNFYSTN